MASDRIPSWVIGTGIAVAWMIVPVGMLFWTRFIPFGIAGCCVAPVAAGIVHRSWGILWVALGIGACAIVAMIIVNWDFVLAS